MRERLLKFVLKKLPIDRLVAIALTYILEYAIKRCKNQGDYERYIIMAQHCHESTGLLLTALEDRSFSADEVRSLKSSVAAIKIKAWSKGESTPNV